jgi:hypothetical protein
MAILLSPISKSKVYEITTKKPTKTSDFEGSIAKLSFEENALLEEVNLQEWRKNLKLVRERNPN